MLNFAYSDVAAIGKHPSTVQDILEPHSTSSNFPLCWGAQIFQIPASALVFKLERVNGC